MSARRALTWVTGIAVRALLAFYPRDFRRRFRDDVLVEWRDDMRHATGTADCLRTAFAVLLDVAGGLAGEHLSAVRGRTTGRSTMTYQSIGADLKLAARRLRVQRATVALVAGILALAVGASTAIFSVADAVLLRPLPFAHSERLVRLDEQTAQVTRAGVSFPAIEIWSRETRALEAVAFFEAHTALVIVNDEPDRLAGATASRGFNDVLGVVPVQGRGFSATPFLGAPNEALIGYALWQRLGGTSAVIGRSLSINAHPFTIIGVMPPDFSYPAEAQYWTSPPADMEMIRPMRDIRFLEAIGRLRPGVTPAALQAELALLTERYPATDRIGGAVRLTASGLHDSVVRPARTGILVVAASAALLLLIACCNISALLLARSTLRQRDFAVQAALGASRGRLIRQSVFEMLLLSLPAAALGVALAWLCRDAVVALGLGEVPRISLVAIDGRALAFALITTIGATLIATLLPAWLSSRADAAAGLRNVTRGELVSRRVLPVLRVLVVLEVAVTCVLAVAAILLARTVDGLASVDRGFNARDVVAMRIHMPLNPLPSKETQLAIYDVVRARAAAVPGVESVGFGLRLPLSEAIASAETTIAGEPGPAIKAVLQASGPGFLSTIGTQIVEGREIADEDKVAPRVVLNEVLARQLFPGNSAVGRRIRFQYMTGPVEAEVVGVSRPLLYNGLASTPLPELYFDYRIRPTQLLLFARMKTGSDAAIPMLKAAILGSDASRRLSVDQITTLDREVARKLARPRFFLALVGTFSGVAILLAAAGLYGVMSFAVAQRRHELGVRLALGASPSELFRQVVGRGAALTGMGLVIGIAAAAGTVQVMRTLLFGVAPRDPITFAAASLAVSLIAITACVIPAHRARRTDPLAVLRSN